ncbi:DUF2271 domain-containing protein [Roseibium sp. FZY0029]|uniref:DUF2271 domain-containing protein n=1 Tax=Roseibium sp. FZY0029 TaxID=3116647 RepID=UPI002E9DED6B|nr:DUF2271 domain-containing protein [Roseibium sp. FZY0029]
MKNIACALLLSTALVMPATAMAKDVNVTVDMKSYGGPGAYLAVYLVDGAGQFQQTLWVAGRKSKYYRHLKGWARGVSSTGGSIDGLTGPSVGSGRSLTVRANIADALINAGYQIVVDSAVEDWGDRPHDAAVPLVNGASAGGSGFVGKLSVKM